MRGGEAGGSYPASNNNGALRAIYDNLRAELSAERVAEPGARWEPDTETDPREVAALAVDRAIRQARMADWRGHPIKEKRIGRAIRDALGPFKAYTNTICGIVKARSEY